LCEGSCFVGLCLLVDRGSKKHQFLKLKASCDVKVIKGNFNIIMLNLTFTVF